MIGHPREQVLLAFQEHRLADERRRRLASHLASCQRCRNLVQQHRAVRAALALEAPSAPDGVLERVLASRAAGMVMVLPVTDPGRAAAGRRPFRMIGVAAALVLAVAGVQLVPTAALREAWSDWSQAVADWDLFDGPGLFDVPFPASPIAKPATFDVARLRPMTAQYVRVSTQLQNMGRRNTFRYTLERDDRGWVITESWNRGEPNRIVRFDPTTLGVTEWERHEWEGDRHPGTAYVWRYALRGDRFEESGDWIGTPPAHRLRLRPRRELTTWPYTPRQPHPLYVGDGHFYAQLMAIPFELGWAGSLLEVSSWGVRGIGDLRPVSYLVARDEMVTTPLGTFDTWYVKMLLPMPRWEMSYSVRKSDGVVVRTITSFGDDSTTYLLESLTFP